MPRWFALCRGSDLPSCTTCRRMAERHPTESEQQKQEWTTPALIGHHCNRYIEQPAYITRLHGAPIPTDQR